MNSRDFPEDFQACVCFHGHVCPGLAIGYAAVKAGSRVLGLSTAKDEEIVALVENNSCAVDAVQVLLSCTFGKGNLIFRDWGKQVFTFFERRTGRAVRVSFNGQLPGRDERRALKKKIDAGEATDAEKQTWDQLRTQAVMAIISADPAQYFRVKESHMEMPPRAQIVATQPCDICGEATVTGRMMERRGRRICQECFASLK